MAPCPKHSLCVYLSQVTRSSPPLSSPSSVALLDIAGVASSSHEIAGRASNDTSRFWEVVLVLAKALVWVSMY